MYACMQICKNVSMQICKNASMKIRNNVSMHVCTYEYERQGPAPRAFFGQNRN